MRAYKRENGQKVAIKIIQKQKLDDEDAVKLQGEIDILRHVDHPNVVQLKEVYE
jgi:serine/threonine protein kinase